MGPLKRSNRGLSLRSQLSVYRSGSITKFTQNPLDAFGEIDGFLRIVRRSPVVQCVPVVRAGLGDLGLPDMGVFGQNSR